MKSGVVETKDTVGLSEVAAKFKSCLAQPASSSHRQLQGGRDRRHSRGRGIFRNVLWFCRLFARKSCRHV